MQKYECSDTQITYFDLIKYISNKDYIMKKMTQKTRLIKTMMRTVASKKKAAWSMRMRVI